MITAMTYLLIILAIAFGLAVWTIDLLRKDGRGPAAPPQSHYQDPRFSSPAASR